MALAYDTKKDIERTIHQRFNDSFFSRDHHPLAYRFSKLHFVPLCIRILSGAMMIQFASLTRSDVGRSRRSTSYPKANVEGTHDMEFLDATKCRHIADRILGALRLNRANQCVMHDRVLHTGERHSKENL